MTTINSKELTSALSELQELHRESHRKNFNEQITQAMRSELGCPICDVGNRLLADDEMFKEFFDFMMSSLGIRCVTMATVLGLQFDVFYSHTSMLSLGIIIGRKQAQVEAMKVKV
jgi:hypothetical protein